MKKILMLIASLGVIPLVTSCADYGVYGYGSTVARPVVATNTAFVGGGLAPLQVGFVATTFDRWAWDPFRRHYFDRSCGRFFDPRLRRYCTVVPRRFPTAVYPSGYRRGGRLACPSFLPRTRFAGGHRDHRGHVGVPARGGRFAPVVHGTSRGAVPLGDAGRSGRFSNGRANESRSPIRRSASPSSRRSVNPATISRRSRLETVSTSPSRSRIESRPSSPVSPRTVSRGSSSGNRASAPVVRSRSSATVPSRATSQSRPVSRSRQVTRSRPTRATPSSAVPSRGSSRATSNTSRAISRMRQRTR